MQAAASAGLRALRAAVPALAPRRHMSIHLKTRLNAVCNSGAKEVECIDFFARRPAQLGDAIRCVVKAARPDGKVSKKDIVAAVVVRQRALHQRSDGTSVRFQENAVVLMKRDLSGPIGTRVSGPVCREIRQGRFMKLALMASRVI